MMTRFNIGLALMTMAGSKFRLGAVHLCTSSGRQAGAAYILGKFSSWLGKGFASIL